MVYRYCNCIRQNPRRFPWFCFGMCLSRGKSTTRFGEAPIFRRKETIFIGREKTHILQTKINEKKIAKVSPFVNKYVFKIKKTIQQQQEYNLGRLRFNRRGASTPLWGSWSMLSPQQAAQPNPSYPALCRQDTTSPWAPTTEETGKLWH